MKAKYYIGIATLFLIAASPAKAQRNDPVYSSNDDARVVVNNYYNSGDFEYASRINRFHRSYAVFDYYSPVFTDSYWYDYEPWNVGLNFYGGGFGLNYGYGNYYGYDPYFGVNYYWNYDPFYYNCCLSPFFLSFNFGNRWRYNDWGWGGHHNYYGYNDNRYDHHWGNSHYGYNSNRYSYSGSQSRRNQGSGYGSPSYNNNVYRRQNSSGNYTRNEVNNSRTSARSVSSYGQTGARRTVSPANNGQVINSARRINTGNTRYYANNNSGIQNRRNITATGNNYHYDNNVARGTARTGISHVNSGNTSHSFRSSGSVQTHSSSSRSISSGSRSGSSSSHGSSRSSGSRSGSSGGRSSGRR
jgi:hypothetical protein